MNRPDRDALHALLSAVVDGTVSQEQGDQLARLLRSDSEARRFYVRYIDMHAALTSGQLPRATMRVHRTPWSVVAASIIAASLLIGLVLVPPLRRGGNVDHAPATGVAVVKAASSGYVATVASASSEAILDGQTVVPGARLASGEHRLTAGGVNIRFDGGARILLEGTSSFAINSRREMRIDEGTFVFHGDQTCESIEIVTPHSVFKNIGTQYAAVINSQREEVHVAEGAVRRTTGDAPESEHHELIEAGVGRRYDLEDTNGESVPLNGSLVSRSLDGHATDARLSHAAVWDGFRGDSTQVDGLKSGAGWIGPWESRRGGLRVSTPGLSGDGSAALVHDGSASAEPKSAAHRRFGVPIDLSTDGIWYLRFLVRRAPAPPRDEHLALVVLRMRGLTTQEEIDRSALIQIGFRRHDGVFLRIADALARASLPQTPGQEYAVVAKIVAGRSQPDQVLLNLMAAERLPGSAEPAEWSLVSEEVNSDLRFEKLSLEFSSSGQIAVGDLCIGPTWASVAQPLER